MITQDAQDYREDQTDAYILIRPSVVIKICPFFAVLTGNIIENYKLPLRDTRIIQPLRQGPNELFVVLPTDEISNLHRVQPIPQV